MDAIIPQPIFTILGITINSTIISTWIGMIFIIGSVIILKSTKPALLEMLIEFISSFISDVMNTDDIEPYLPFLGSLAIFIAVSNNLGLFPILSSPTSDINTPIALALVVFFSVHIYGIKKKGGKNYAKDFASPIFLLPLEIMGQISRTLSLSLRLFGNILSTDLIVLIMMNILPVIVPLPIMGLGALTALLQAYIFTSLASVYIASAIK